MAKNKTRKHGKTKEEKELQAFNPTKSTVGKFIILILAIGMFLAMLIAAIYGMINVLTS